MYGGQIFCPRSAISSPVWLCWCKKTSVNGRVQFRGLLKYMICQNGKGIAHSQIGGHGLADWVTSGNLTHYRKSATINCKEVFAHKNYRGKPWEKCIPS